MCATSLKPPRLSIFFSFNDTATTEIYTLSLHDALPIWEPLRRARRLGVETPRLAALYEKLNFLDRKSTRLNSSHLGISYAVSCLKTKKQTWCGSSTTTSDSECSNSTSTARRA